MEKIFTATAFMQFLKENREKEFKVNDMYKCPVAQFLGAVRVCMEVASFSDGSFRNLNWLESAIYHSYDKYFTFQDKVTGEQIEKWFTEEFLPEIYRSVTL